MTPLAWSHSALESFNTCARQYEEVRVLHHFRDSKNAAALWGDTFHKAAEQHIGAVVARMRTLGYPNRELAYDVATADTRFNAPCTLPASMSQYREYLQPFCVRAGETFAECRYALNRQLQPCSFLHPDVWTRGIIDVLTRLDHVAWVDDHKTGKNRKKDMQQLIIFALLTFYHHPEIDTCHTAYHWLQHGFDESAKDRETFHRHQIPELWAALTPVLQRYAAAFHAGIFPPKPSGLCKKNCVVNTCEFWGVGTRR